MDEIEEFVDERQKSWCIHCGRAFGKIKVNKDHVPSKCILLQPFPANLPKVTICKACNEGFSFDEEYTVAFLSCVLSGSTQPNRQLIPRATRILSHGAKLRERIESAKTEYKTQGGETRFAWAPEYQRIERVVLKNARGHAF